MIGSIIKGYEIRELIGTGGFGAVYRAFQPVIEREVAVKIILPEYANQAEFIRGFEAEAQIVAHLEHPYIVPLYDYWRDPDGAFLVMRYLHAGNLSKHLRQSPLSPNEVLRMVEQISSALATAHRNGVVHRDLKPDNILLDDENNAFLTDFGIAKLVGNDISDQSVSGSLRYIAPEQLRAEPTTIASDIYSFGLMIFEMFTGQYPFGELTPSQLVMKHLEDPIPDIRDVLPNLPDAVNRVLQKATEKTSGQRYTDVREVAKELRTAFSQTVSVDFEGIQDFGDIVNPYKGLRPFQEADAVDFFGRDMLVAHLLERLSDHHRFQRFLAVVGPSGSGKSSVVRAGVIPALRSGALSLANKWFIVDMVPGFDPLKQLESALLSIALRPPPRLYDMLTADENGLLWAVDRVLADSDSELLLVIDQFEEVFTNVESEEVRHHFLRSLQKAISSPDSRLRLIITLRADFTDRPLEYVEFGELMQQRTEFILPLSALEIESAIIGPAQRVGLQVDSSLVSQIVADVREEPGALPLLQYALTEVFERREDNRLTLEGYLESGGVLGALARRAEELYVSLEPEAQRIVRQMLLRLVTLGEGTEDTRRRSRRSEIAEVVQNNAGLQSVLDQFGHYRLLTFDFESGTREPTLEVAHEALIREWQRLRGWLDSSRADLRLQRVLTSEAAEWEKNHQDTSFLLSGTRLSSYEEWMSVTDLALSNRELAYIRASIQERHRRSAAEEERHRREEETARRADQFAKRAQQLRRAATLLGIVGALAVVAVIFAITQVTNTRVQVAAGETQIAGVQPTLDVAQSRIDGAQTQIAGVQPTLDMARNQIDGAQTQIAGIQPTVTAAQFQIDNAQTQIAGVQPTLAAGQTQVAGIEPTLQAANSRVDVAETQVAAVQPTLAAGQTQVAGIEPTLQAANSRVDVAETQVAAVQPTVTAAQLQLGSAQTQVAAVLPTLQAGQTQIAAVEPTLLAADERANTAGTQVAGIQPTVQAAQSQIDAIVPTLQYAETRAAGVEPTLQAANNRVDSAETQVAAVQPTLTHVNQQALQAEDRILEANAALTAVPPTLDAIATQVRAGEDRIVSLNLASEATTILAQASGDPELAALLSIRALQADYTESADFALVSAVDDLHVMNVFRGHAGWVVKASYSPDGRFIVSASHDNTARVWDAITGKEVHVLRGHDAEVLSASYSPDGRFIVTSSVDATARIWDASTGDELIALMGHDNVVFSAVYSPDGRYVLTGGWDMTIRIWDALTGTLLQTLQTGASVQNALYSPDGRFIISIGSRLTEIWNAETEIPTRIFSMAHESGVSSAAFSPDSQFALTAERNGIAHVWDLETQKEILTLRGHEGPINSAVYSPDGRYIVTSGGADDSPDNTARIWDATTGIEVRTLRGHRDVVSSAAYSPDGRSVVTASYDGTLRTWNADLNSNKHIFGANAGKNLSAAFSPDSRYIIVGTENGLAFVWNVGTGEKVYTLSAVDPEAFSKDVIAVEFSPDGQVILTAVGGGDVRFWDASTGREVRSFNVVSTIWSATYSPDRQFILTHNYNDKVRVWETSTGVELFALEGNIQGATFSPDGKFIATVSMSSDDSLYEVRVWDIETGESKIVVDGLESGLNSVSYHPDGHHLVVTNWDRTIQVWNIDTGHPDLTLQGHVTAAWDANYSPDGQFILSAGGDGTVYIWNAQTGDVVRALHGHNIDVYTARYDPTGRYIVTASFDGTTRIWDADYNDLITYACTRITRDFSDDERTRYGIRDSNPTCPQFAG